VVCKVIPGIVIGKGRGVWDGRVGVKILGNVRPHEGRTVVALVKQVKVRGDRRALTRTGRRHKNHSIKRVC
jgi:hypothetical protein